MHNMQDLELDQILDSFRGSNSLRTELALVKQLASRIQALNLAGQSKCFELLPLKSLAQLWHLA